MMIPGTLIPLFFIVAAGLLLYFYFKNRHAERMLIIEKGTGADELKYLLGGLKRKSNPFTNVKWGLILASVGLAIILGNLYIGIDQEAVTAGMIFLFPGIALVVYYLLFGKKEQEYAEKSQS